MKLKHLYNSFAGMNLIKPLPIFGENQAKVKSRSNQKRQKSKHK
jgi:hypothetical protein